jgi:hypothetical protein
MKNIWQPGGPEMGAMKNDSVTSCLQQDVLEQFPNNHLAKSRGLKEVSVTTLIGTAELNKLLVTTKEEMIKSIFIRDVDMKRDEIKVSSIGLHRLRSLVV